MLDGNQTDWLIERLQQEILAIRYAIKEGLDRQEQTQANLNQIVKEVLRKMRTED